MQEQGLDIAILGFDYRRNNLEAGDFVAFQISTTGGSVLTAVEALQDAGAEVVAVAVVVERGAAPKVEAAGLPYVYAYSLDDLGL